MASTIANTTRGAGTKAYAPGDFMPRFSSLPGARRREQTVDELRAVFDGMVAAHQA